MIRRATSADADAILALVTAHREEGHLLPRSRDGIAGAAHRFLVVEQAGELVACAELAPLSRSLAEVRSLVVGVDARGAGLGQRLVNALRDRAEHAGFEQLCAFTHRPAWFCRMGFSIVPHTWLVAKVHTDCVKCPLFRRCGQEGVVLGLHRPATSGVAWQERLS